MAKKNYIYILILIVLVALSIYFLTNNRESSIDSIKKDFSIEDTASVTKIFIAQKNGKTIKVERQKDNSWLVNGKFKARRELIKVVLETLKQMKIKSPVNRPMREGVMKDLATSSTKVEVYSGDKKLKTLYVGPSTIDGLGTFMLLEGSGEPFITHIPGFDGYLSTRFTTDELIWKDREVFRFVPPRIDLIKIDYPNDQKGSFELKIENINYARLINGAGEVAKDNINGEFLRQYLGLYQDVQYESLISLRKSQQDSVLYPGNLLCTITVYDKEGNKKSARLYQRFYNGLEFVQSGNEAEYDTERIFVLTDKNEIANGQTRIFNKLMVKYSDFFGPPQKIID
jgi:hypothetical protein